MSADDVERVIASCDTASAVGRRDHAILLLLARLGLRAGDIVYLRLRDIDWKAQFEAACEAFRSNRVLILVDDRQVERLDQTIDLRPATAKQSATSVTFLKLTPLVGG